MTTPEEWDGHREETVEDLRATLARHHPELSAAAIDRILSGPPPRRKMTTRTDAGWYENKGRRASPFMAGGGTGRTTAPRRSTMKDSGE